MLVSSAEDEFYYIRYVTHIINLEPNIEPCGMPREIFRMSVTFVYIVCTYKQAKLSMRLVSMMRGFCPRGLCLEGAYVLMELCMGGFCPRGFCPTHVVKEKFCMSTVIFRLLVTGFLYDLSIIMFLNICKEFLQ